MLYILSGIAKSGKSTLANWILQDKKISHFSTDYLMMALSKGNPICGIDDRADDKVVAKAMQPYLLAMIQTIIHNGTDYLIEGVHFNPDFAAKLIAQYPYEISFLYLGYAQVTAERKRKELEHYRQVVPNVWYKDYDEAEMEKLVEFMIGESQTLEKRAHHYNIPYLNITDLPSQKQAIYELLFGH